MTPRSPTRKSPGFTLVELMVVMAIISILITMVVTGIWGARRHFAKVEAKLTMKNMHVGLTSLKRNADYDPMTPIGVWTGGRTGKGATSFTDPDRDFGADGISAGDTVYILSGADTGERSVTAVSVSTLTLDGANFTADELSLDYFIIKDGGEAYPEIDLAKELDPTNKAWSATFTPHLNGRKRRYYPCKDKRIKNGEFQDPWGHPYVYSLKRDDDVIIEKIGCAGIDGLPGTKDDIEEVITEIPFGG